ncbi:hypothetical protein BD410DRAFT_720612 [Rickenella mellea]|uniref:Uncharacterized protein n=1 Tax=Rickenella mellea TaxID=50990 RepID=A0A4Y7QAG5_9AGAM|nr:hypothetical protein BD410DRAFT_734928 [Rickenella mellea]TDL23859.1 hypothetical protein BD410DRAFT_720612 [Rickenella mellea]
MAEYSAGQLEALSNIKTILENAGLSSVDLDISQGRSAHASDIVESGGTSSPSPQTVLQYIPPRATVYNESQIGIRLNQINRKSYASALANHPEGSVVEYPETGQLGGEAVAHRFKINPREFVHPKVNIQYALGDEHGGRTGVKCHLISDPPAPVLCTKTTYKCKGTKQCEFAAIQDDNTSHSFVEGTPSKSFSTQHQSNDTSWSAAQEVFYKTLALFTTLQHYGCAFEADPLDSSGDLDDLSDDEDSVGSQETGPCHGELLMRKDKYGRAIIECQHRRKGHKAHLRLGNLGEYDLTYLSALFNNDKLIIDELECKAQSAGYGPRIPCTISVPATCKRQNCSEWHRLPSGWLDRGKLQRDTKCNTVFEFYTPDNLDEHPYVLVVCRNPHTHAPPAPVKTPPFYLGVFKKLLISLDWKLADATPRRILLDSGFMLGLRAHLGWGATRDPMLSDLHPSLANLDHIRRIIHDLREQIFPAGTGMAGAENLCEEHSKLPLEERYVRIAEQIHIGGFVEESIRIVVCMSPPMSHYLMAAKRVSIDTSFKRVHGWEEFEIEVWHNASNRSLVVCRAFVTSQSAEAHFKLFKRIFSIAEADTGIAVRFRHIHGEGFDSWIADAHKGQALGLGMFCQWLCRDETTVCSDEPPRQLQDLTQYEHLARFYRLCITHFKRKIRELRSSITPEVQVAMLSLSSAEVHPDLQGAFATIRAGGKKANAWLDDKLTGSKFAFPAIYQPVSKIPIEVWRASPATTNGNEQAHRGINRDGVNLTLLAGIMRGMQYDARAIKSIVSFAEVGIHSRDQTSTHFYRTSRAVGRQGSSFSSEP